MADLNIIELRNCLELLSLIRTTLTAAELASTEATAIQAYLITRMKSLKP